MPTTEITIVGAGPYGLSIAAHLAEQGADFRIIGTPMESWINNMPNGMLLKSEGVHSSLYAPGNAFTLKDYCRHEGLPYHDLTVPVHIDTFTSYCIAFQKKFVPQIENRKLVSLKPHADGFELTMADGTSFVSKKVVVATGHDAHRLIPKSLANLPKEFCTHSGDHKDMTVFKDKDVIVVGGGSSAIDLTTLLHENGARVLMVSRKTALDYFPSQAPKRSFLDRLFKPMLAVGSDLRWTDAAWLCQYWIDRVKIMVGRKLHNTVNANDTMQRFKNVPHLLGFAVTEAKLEGGRVVLSVADSAGNQKQLTADHVIAATGYPSDIQRFTFLAPEIVGKLLLIEQCPKLSPYFESSVPGLYFVGGVSIPSFGSMMRFVAGAGFTSQRIVRSLTGHSKKIRAAASREANSKA